MGSSITEDCTFAPLTFLENAPRGEAGRGSRVTSKPNRLPFRRLRTHSDFIQLENHQRRYLKIRQAAMLLVVAGAYDNYSVIGGCSARARARAGAPLGCYARASAWSLLVAISSFHEPARGLF